MDSEHKRQFVRKVERDDHHVILDVSQIELKNMRSGSVVQFRKPLES